MELTYHTDYAFRVLMYAGANPGRRVTLREISEAYGISKEHLRKVVHKLAQEGFLSTAKGRAGGLVLGRDPASIRVGDVVQVMEGSMAIVNCNRQPCPLTGRCALKSVFNRGQRAFLTELNKASLADLLGEERTFSGIRILTEAV
jgi:Rrf2 family transcriptional regulator, nitric oxide-sensitive transcriptional repressor